MKGISAPNNSIANLNEGCNVSTSSTAHSTPLCESKTNRKSQLTETNFSIIEKTIEKRKTLICAEKNSFHVLHKMKSNNLPTKKFNSMVPSEYEKFTMKILNIKVNHNENLKYEYPENLLDEGNKLVSVKEKRVKAVTCLVF